MSIENQDISTHMDDNISDGPSEQELLDAVMANSEFTQMEDIPLPEEEEIVEDPAEADEEVEDPDSEEVVSEEDEEEVEEDVDEDGADEAPTQEADVFTADDLDLDAKVQVKIDGEEMEVSFGDLLKGYQTDSHLSKKGRELGEAVKAFEEERAGKLQEVQAMGEASAAILFGAEQAKQKEYHDIEAKIEQARKDGDTYEMNELKDKREQVQKEYWGARRQREGLSAQLQEQKQAQEAAAWQKQMDHFAAEIPNLIPDFNEEVAGNIRSFALDDIGLSADILDTITDPKVVAAMHDYMNLKKGIAKGQARRKATPAKKAIPHKKAKPATKKAEDAAKMKKARAFREDASPEQQMDFLRDYASKSLNLK